jgi:hypothetical protein
MKRWGFPITRRPDGLFDIANLGRGVTPGQLMDTWLTLRAWPRPIWREHPPIVPPSCQPGSWVRVLVARRVLLNVVWLLIPVPELS